MTKRRRPARRAPTKAPTHPNLEPPPKTIGEHPVHPAAVLPEVAPSTEARLVASIKRHGLRDPIVRVGGQVLAGRARYRACLQAGVEPRFVDLEPDNPLEWVLDEALTRREISRSGRALTAGRAANLAPGRPSAKVQGRTVSIEQAARRCGVSVRLVKSARKVLKAGLPRLVRAVELGLVSVSRAEALAAMPTERQQAFVDALALTTTAAQRKALLAEYTGAPSSRIRDAGAVIGDLVRHVQEADAPGARLGQVLDKVASLAGYRLRGEPSSLVQPVVDDDTADATTEERA